MIFSFEYSKMGRFNLYVLLRGRPTPSLVGATKMKRIHHSL